MTSWLLYFVPWWFWLGLAISAALLVHRLVGWRNAILGLAVVLALVFSHRSRQQGWRDREEKGREDADKAIDMANSARADAAERNADPSRLRDDDGYRRD